MRRLFVTAPLPPVLFRTGACRIVTFGVFAALAMLAGGVLTLHWQATLGLGPAVWFREFILWLAAAIVLGARAYALLLDVPALRSEPWGTLRRTSFAFQGGLCGGLVVVAITAYRHALPLLAFADSVALALPVAHAIGRIGCLSYGCCHGRPAHSGFAIVYRDPEAKAVWGSRLGGVPLHATQLYSAAANLALLGVMLMVLQSGAREGTLTATYLIGGGLGRLAAERLRGIPVGRFAGLTPFQWFSLAQVSLGLLVLSVARARPYLPVGDVSLTELMTLRDGGAIALAGLLTFVVFGVHGRRVGTY